MGELIVLRHGETVWSRGLRHTGRTDLPLTPAGEAAAAALAPALAARPVRAAFTSPARRAVVTAALAGLAGAKEDPDLQEWDYGGYEGRTTADIQAERPGWYLWRDGVIPLVAHGHLLRVLTARWLRLDPAAGRLFQLKTATLSTLGTEHGEPVITSWNVPPMALPV
jgi:probable phosphoglycerate mutase